MFVFQKLPFYAKYGAIPESYLIALSYEEQLLWLCKHIEDLDEKIETSFARLMEYINAGLESLENSKQDKLTAGENIIIDNNTISAYFGDLLTDDIIDNYAIPQNEELGNVLDLTPVSMSNCAYIIIDEKPLGTKLKIKGLYTWYVIDSNNVILEVHRSGTGHSVNPDSYEIYTTTQTGRIAIGFYQTDVYSYYLELINSISDVLERIDNLETDKQDKLIAGDNITIENNVISATGGSGGVSVTKLESSLNLEDTSSITGLLEGFYDTDSYNIEIVDTPHNVVAFAPEEIVYFDSLNLVFIGSTKSVSWNYSNQAWEITDNREIALIKAQIPQVTYLDSNITLTNGTEPDYATGWYYLNNHDILLSNGGHSTSVFTGKDIVYYDNTLKAFTNGIKSLIYSSSTWSVQMLQGIVNTLNTNQDNIPTCYAVSQAISSIPTSITNETTGTTSSVSAIWSGTQTEYDNLASYDSTTLYFIKE